jgi:hypothetical protein
MSRQAKIENIQEMLDWAYQKQIHAASGDALDGRRKRIIFWGLPTGEGLGVGVGMPWHVQVGNEGEEGFEDTQYSTLRMAIEVYNSI